METADPNVSQRAARDRNGSGGDMEIELQYDRVKTGGSHAWATLGADEQRIHCATAGGSRGVAEPCRAQDGCVQERHHPGGPRKGSELAGKSVPSLGRDRCRTGGTFIS